MPENLDPDGAPVRIGGVELVTPGLRGLADVHLPASPGMRAAEAATDDLLAAFESVGVSEQLTVEVREPEELPLYQPTTSRSTATGDPAVQLTVPGPGTGQGQFLLYADEEGVLTWHLPDDIEGPELTSRAGDRRNYTIPRKVSAARSGGSRSVIGAVGRKIFKVVTFGLVDRAIGAVGDHFVDRWERVNRPHRLRHFGPDDYRRLDVEHLTAAGARHLAEGPALCFIHGTFGRSDATFAQLQPEVVGRLHRRYGGRVFAFDHPTVGTSPEGNVEWLARWLADHLPDGRLDVDIVAHSRGGLVGRLLAAGGASGAESGDRIRVGNLVFVATPNAGTVLASRDRVGDLLDTVTNIVEFVPDNPVTTTLEVVLTVLKQLATGLLGGLDGLHCMDPAGPFLRSLNGPGPHPHVRLLAVASNFQPGPDEPLGRFMRDRLTDAVFSGGHNDLVVPTESVYRFGHPNRQVDEHITFPPEDAVDHSSYWTRPRFVDALDRWLDPAGR